MRQTSGLAKAGGGMMAEMLYFLCCLIPPRSDFMTTMTPEERAIMQAHVGYWAGKVATGNALAFGPVADPKGGYGIGIIKVSDPAEMDALRAADPAMQADIGFSYEVLPMPRLVMAGLGA
jgi:hypothetical protein